MHNASFDGQLGLDAADSVQTEPSPTIDQGEEQNSELLATVATVGVVGVGAAVFEAALLPGIVLGVAAMWLPQHFPKVGAALNPLFKSTVRGVYKVRQKTREMMAEAQEQVNDIVAEVKAEDDAESTPAKAEAGLKGGSPV